MVLTWIMSITICMLLTEFMGITICMLLAEFMNIIIYDGSLKLLTGSMTNNASIFLDHCKKPDGSTTVLTTLCKNMHMVCATVWYQGIF